MAIRQSLGHVVASVVELNALGKMDAFIHGMHDPQAQTWVNRLGL